MKTIQNILSLNLPFMIALEQKFPSTIGYAYGVISMLLFACTNLSIRICKNIPTSQLFYYRVLCLAIILYYCNTSQGVPPITKSKRLNRLLICVGITSTIAGPLLFQGFQLVPLSEGVVILQTQPAIASILAVFILKESYDFLQFVSSIFCTIGVVLIAKPGFIFSREIVEDNGEAERMKGIISLLIGGFTLSIQAMLIKKIVKSASGNLSAFYIGLVPAIISSGFILQGGIIPLTGTDIIMVGNVVMFGYFAQVLFNRAFKFSEAGKISVIAYTQIIFGYVLDVFIMGTELDFYSVSGAALIFSCFFLRIYNTLKHRKEIQDG